MWRPRREGSRTGYPRAAAFCVDRKLLLHRGEITNFNVTLDRVLVLLYGISDVPVRSSLEWWVSISPTGPDHDRSKMVKIRFICPRDIRVAASRRVLARSIALARLCVQPVAFSSIVMLERLESGQVTSIAKSLQAPKHSNIVTLKCQHATRRNCYHR